MNRISLSHIVGQRWLFLEGKNYLDISSRLDRDGLFVVADNYLEYGLRLSSLLKFSDEDVDKAKVDVRVESVEDNSDVDLLYVDKVDNIVNPNSVSVFVSGVQKKHDIRVELVVSVLEKLSSGGLDVYKSLINLSMGIDEIFPVSEDYDYNYIAEVLSIGLSRYYRNPLFLGGNILSSNIVRDIIDKRVDRDTVAFFSKLFTRYKNESNFSELKAVKIKEIIRRLVPELYGIDLFNILKSSDEINFEIMLAPFVEFVSNMKSVGLVIDVNDLVPYYNKIDNFAYLSRHYAEILKIYIENKSPALNSVSLNALESELIKSSRLPRVVLDLMMKDLRNAAKNFGNDEYKSIELSSVYEPFVDLLGSDRFSCSDGNYVVGENSYDSFGLLKEDYYVYGNVIGTEGERRVDNYYEKVLADKNYLGLHGVELPFSYKVLFYECEKVGGELGLKFIRQAVSDSKFRDLFFVKEYIPIYLEYFKSESHLSQKIDKFIKLVNKFYPLLGEKIYNFKLYTLESFDDLQVSREQLLRFLDEDMAPLIAGYYASNPYMIDISFDEWFEFNRERNKDKFYEDSPIISDKLIVAWSNPNFSSELYLSGKILFILGRVMGHEYDKFAKLISAKNININTREYYKNILLGVDNFVGNLSSSLNTESNQILLEENFTSAEISVYNRDSDKNRILRVRDLISRYKNYSSIVFGSVEYNKLFSMIYEVPGVRGRDSKLLISLFDDSVNNQNSDYNMLFRSINAGSGFSDFPSIPMSYYNLFINIKNHVIEFLDNLEDDHKSLCERLKTKKESIINVGGFDVLLNESPEVLAKELNIHPNDREEWFRELSDVRNNWSSYSWLREEFLRIDFRVLKNKLVIYVFGELFKRNPELGTNLVEILKTEQSEYLDIGIDICDEIANKIMYGDISFVKSIYGMKVDYSKVLKLPKFMDNKSKLNEFYENIRYAGNIVRFFNKDLQKFLNLYSVRYCQSAGFPPNGYDSIPDIGLKTTIIHNLGNILPDNFAAYDEKLVLYYENNLGIDDVKLKFVANSWNNIIAVLNEDMKFVSRGFVREFADNYSVLELAELVKRYSAVNLFKSLDVKSSKFGLEFIERYNVPDDTDSNSSRYKMLFRKCEDIYLKGLEVEMPSWSKFRNEINGMTLRFLSRDDPRGMMLGVITGCCQHPRGQAATCAYDGHLNKNACFAVFEVEGKILYQSYVWDDGNGNVCFDSVERKDKFDKNWPDTVQELMVSFSKSIEGICTVGSNPLKFRDFANPRLINPTKTYLLPEVNAMSIYSSDSYDQQIVK